MNPSSRCRPAPARSATTGWPSGIGAGTPFGSAPMSSPPTPHSRPSPPSRESPSSRPATPSSTHVQGSSHARSSISLPPNSRSHGGRTTTGRSSKTSQEQPDRQSQLAPSPKATPLERVPVGVAARASVGQSPVLEVTPYPQYEWSQPDPNR